MPDTQDTTKKLKQAKDAETIRAKKLKLRTQYQKQMDVLNRKADQLNPNKKKEHHMRTADRLIDEALSLKENWWAPTVTITPYVYQGGYIPLAPDHRIKEGDVVWVIKGREKVDPRGLYVAAESAEYGPINVLAKQLKKAGKPVVLTPNEVRYGGASGEIKAALQLVRDYIRG